MHLCFARKIQEIYNKIISMKTDYLVFTISINGTREQVWNALYSDAGYREWTSVFSKGSHAVTDWKKGSKALFLDEGNNGLLATIADVRPNEFMSIRHHGDVRNGVEIQNLTWSGYENHTLQTVAGKTELTVGLDVPENFVDEMNRLWPAALEQIKAIAERQPA